MIEELFSVVTEMAMTVPVIVAFFKAMEALGIWSVVVSIVAVTAVVWLLNRFVFSRVRIGTLRFPSVCPICAGVSVTWAWMLFGVWFGLFGGFGQIFFLFFAAMLMGGSVVGIAYQGDKRLSQNRSPLAWKTAFIPAGFIFAYGILVLDAAGIIFGGAVIAISALWFFVLPRFVRKSGELAFGNPEIGRGANADAQAKELEEKLKDCCS